MFENDHLPVENYVLVLSTSKQLLYYFYINYSKNDKLKKKISEKYQSIWSQIITAIQNIIVFDIRGEDKTIDEKCKTRFISKNPSIMNRINNTFLSFDGLLGSFHDCYGLSETQINLRFRIFEVDRMEIKSIIFEPDNPLYKGFTFIQNVRLLFPEDKNVKYDQFILHSDHTSMVMKEGLNNIMLPFSLCKRFEIEYIGKERCKIVILFQQFSMGENYNIGPLPYPFGLNGNDYLITPHCKCDKVLTTYISGKYTRMNVDYTFERFVDPYELQYIEKGLKFLCSEFSVEEIHCHSLGQILGQIL